jgi:hypothetical protein
MTKSPKRPRDHNQWAKFVSDLRAKEAEEQGEPASEERGKDTAAVCGGRPGGLKRGTQRATNAARGSGKG